ncbi:MAG: AAA family ATPase, partial [Deinococcus sp.]|nr:AAA family ATPase [Deinococcus sp.]
AARLVGAPPGYIGFETPGRLTEALRRRPYSVVLFDEIECAHPEVVGLLLPILDEGRLTDSRGRIASFRSAVVVMTCGLPKASREDQAPEITLPHGLIHRIDEIVVLRPLGPAEIRAVVDLHLERIAELLAPQNIGLDVTPTARELLAQRGYIEGSGVRPLPRVIRQLLENSLSTALLAGTFCPGDQVRVEVEGDGLRLEKG